MEAVTLQVKGVNKGHYVPAIKSAGLLFISGQLSLDLDTREVPEPDIRVHTQLALHNVERVLTAAGLTRNDVVQCRIYTSDMRNWDPINEVYAAFFGEHRPSRVVVPVPELHFGCMVEIEAVAECR